MGTQLPWGHKQLHIEHEGEPEDRKKKGSLKKNKVCKVTKGEHIEYHYESMYGGCGYWRCKCGKKVRFTTVCRLCKKELKKWLESYCDACKELDKKTEV